MMPDAIESALDQAFAVVFNQPVRRVIRQPDPAKWVGDSTKWQAMIDKVMTGSSAGEIAESLAIPLDVVERFMRRYASHTKSVRDLAEDQP